MSKNKKMKWWNLKKNKCPKCDKDWTLDLKEVVVKEIGGRKRKLLIHSCGFKISEKKYKKIVTEMVESDLENEND